MLKEAGKITIGVLSLQGGVIEHINHIKKCGAKAIEVKSIDELDNLDGLILPGGESTTMSKILNAKNMVEPLRNRILSGLPVWGTCAGMILLAKKVEDQGDGCLSVIDIKVKRNAYGSQLNSFIATESIETVSENPIPLVFIRAPYIVSIGQGVSILHKIDDKIVAAVQDKILVSSFHPELTNNLEFHKYFINMCER